MILKTLSLLCLITIVGLSACSMTDSSNAESSQPGGLSSAEESPAASNSSESVLVSEEDSLNSVITDFASSTESDQWRTVDDNVMGGLSQGDLAVTQASTGLFSGTISLENNGGFSSVRRNVAGLEMSLEDAIALRIKGDGRQYQFRLKMDISDRAISYRAEFDTTAGEWTTVSLPLSSFEPVFRGRVVADAPPLVPAEVKEIGLLLASKQDGEFELEVDWIQINTD